MARQATRKDLRRVFKKLDGDDRERVLDFAERLADASGGPGGEARESLANDGNPSYLAIADPDRYEFKKKRIEEGKRPDPRE